MKRYHRGLEQWSARHFDLYIMNSKNEILAKEKGYYVDKQGNAFSPRGNMVGTRGEDPYMYFGIRISKTKVVKVYIHRLQAHQKFGDAIFDENIEVRHLNGNSFDNSYDNIAIGTPSENSMDKPADKRQRASLIASDKLKVYSDEMVLEIQLMRNAGLTYSELMKKYNISSKGTLNYILKKRISRNGAVGSLPL